MVQGEERAELVLLQVRLPFRLADALDGPGNVQNLVGGLENLPESALADLAADLVHRGEGLPGAEKVQEVAAVGSLGDRTLVGVLGRLMVGCQAAIRVHTGNSSPAIHRGWGKQRHTADTPTSMVCTRT